ncbi:MAG: hypothetical protein ABFR90_03880 [Planctomycetota bacterium]
MISEKQMQANRQNAQRSTGPKTAAGKAVVSRNALRHGLRARQVVLDSESREEFNEFHELLMDQLAPANLLESLLADRIAADFWRSRRTSQIESQMFNEMRQSLYDKQKAANPSEPTFDDVLYGDFPSLRQSKKAEHKYAFSDPQDVPKAIAAMKDNCRDNPKIYNALFELEQSFRSIAHIPYSRRSIPATRRFLQDISALMFTTDNGKEEDQAEVDQAISDLYHLEKAIRKRQRPNLGQALARDFTGPSVLDKFLRYESHIQRNLLKNMHELERLQARRQNRPVPVPVAVDVDITTEKPLERSQ